jgi:hypothetical protein
MSALHDIKAGPSDGQRAKQAALQEQLKRDLEAQMREKREAEARRKAQLAELEEREEAQLRAYWAQQAKANSPGEKEATQKGGGHGGSLQHGPAKRPLQQQQAAGSAALPPPTSARLHALHPLGAEDSGAAEMARRSEALVQPGVTVFLPPDKEAERRAREEASASLSTGAAAGPAYLSYHDQPPPTACSRSQEACLSSRRRKRLPSWLPPAVCTHSCLSHPWDTCPRLARLLARHS